MHGLPHAGHQVARRLLSGYGPHGADHSAQVGQFVGAMLATAQVALHPRAGAPTQTALGVCRQVFSQRLALSRWTVAHIALTR
jgi:hypothetical protein